MLIEITETYRKIIKYMPFSHRRNEFVNPDTCIAFWNPRLCLYIYVGNAYYQADLTANRKVYWKVEGTHDKRIV